MLQAQTISETVEKHLVNSEAIIKAIAKRAYGNGSQSLQVNPPRCLELDGVKEYQKYIYNKFNSIINIPPFDYISKTESGWLMVNDHRREIAMEISLIIERYGIGVGMMVLHIHQMKWQHILLETEISGRVEILARPTSRINGTRGENIIYVPVRAFRANWEKLAAFNILKPRDMWNESRIVSHESDNYPCFYCSSGEINPSEVVVNIHGTRFGLSRNYALGFTFAPFGNPLSVIHFLAWDCAKKPFNMNRVPMTVSDLVEMTRQINLSIVQFFAGTNIDDFPVIDGISNGWAGNTIYHQHFQFFQPEYDPPIINRNLENRPVLERDDVFVNDLSWETPVYKILADESINVGLIGNDMAGIWRFLGGFQKVPYKVFLDGHIPKENEKVPVHTQNIYIPGQKLGKVAYFLLRDIRLVNFEPGDSEYIDKDEKYRAQKKINIGILEASGTMIVDDHESFLKMRDWESAEVSCQIDKMVGAVSPEKTKVERFKKSIRELFPQ